MKTNTASATPARSPSASLNKSSDKAFVTLSGRIEESMTGNPAFPDPFPKLAVVAAVRDSYVSAVNALDRGADSIALRNKTRKALVQVLRDLALYVQHASQGDRVTHHQLGLSRPAAEAAGVGRPAARTAERAVAAHAQQQPDGRAVQGRSGGEVVPVALRHRGGARCMDATRSDHFDALHARQRRACPARSTSCRCACSAPPGRATAGAIRRR